MIRGDVFKVSKFLAPYHQDPTELNRCACKRKRQSKRKCMENIFEWFGTSEHWPLYTYNSTAAFFHLLQFIIVVFVIAAVTSKIEPDFVFVSPERELIWQNYALIKADTTNTKCTDLESSEMYRDRSSWKINQDMVSHQIFNFNNTVLIPYKKRGLIIRVDIMLATFFLLSALFQYANGKLLHVTPDFPRIINYIEYSISSSLMIMVMAIHMGIVELYTITSLAGLFFGMNLFGACTELIIELYIRLPKSDETETIQQYGWLWVSIPQIAAWVLFLFAIVPVLTQYSIIQECSNTGVPAHVHFAIALQAGIFTLFGFIQSYSIYYRMKNIDDPEYIAYATEQADTYNIAMSFIAKTILAWTLLAPALSVKSDALRR